MTSADDALDLAIENLVAGFRQHGYRVEGTPVPDRKAEYLDELRQGMRNLDYILAHTRGRRAHKLKVLHERLPVPCVGVSIAGT